MRSCLYCGKEIPENAKNVCPSCGRPLRFVDEEGYDGYYENFNPPDYNPKDDNRWKLIVALVGCAVFIIVGGVLSIMIIRAVRNSQPIESSMVASSMYIVSAESANRETDDSMIDITITDDSSSATQDSAQTPISTTESAVPSTAPDPTETLPVATEPSKTEEPVITTEPTTKATTTKAPTTTIAPTTPASTKPPATTTAPATTEPTTKVPTTTEAQTTPPTTEQPTTTVPETTVPKSTEAPVQERKISVTVKIVWDGDAPSSQKIQLTYNGKAIGKSISFTEAKKWKYTWKDLDEDGKYSIKTTIPEGWGAYSLKSKTDSNGNLTITVTFTKGS